MDQPVILTVDDEPDVLNAIERDLRRHFRSRYRVMKAGSGQQALEATQALKSRDATVALFLADERMPHMSGTAFLTHARLLYPAARKVLLTAYADTEAAISGINKVGLDYYLMKPWDPPEERLYPVLDDLLTDWSATYRPPFQGIRVVGVQWSPACHEVRDFLSRNQIPYRWIDIDEDESMRAVAETHSPGLGRLPVVFFPDGEPLVGPDTLGLGSRLGLQTKASLPFYDLVVVGGGPAGLAAAVYGASEGLRTCLVEDDAPGGQAGTSSFIENYLGFPSGISGADLARRAATQAKRFGAEIVVPQVVRSVRLDDKYRYVGFSDGTELSCHALLLASGMAVRRLKVPGVDDLTGAGVYYGAALSEANSCRGNRVFVVGGANSAGQAAMLFSRYADQVTMLVRGATLAAGMSRYLVDRIEAAENIQVMTHTQVVEAVGDGHLSAVRLQTGDDGEVQEFPASHLFIFIGTHPRSEYVDGIVETDDAGFILTGPDLMRGGKRPRGWPLERDPHLLETSVPGIFAAGDVRYGSMKRVAAAVGEGSAAVAMVHRYLETV
jgi:thioredoxin reductase (NADPH)